MFIEQAISAAQKLKLVYEILEGQPDSPLPEQREPYVEITSIPEERDRMGLGTAALGTHYYHYLIISNAGLQAIGSVQGNYGGGIEGRINDPSFPILAHMLTGLPKELRALLSDLQPELMK